MSEIGQMPTLSDISTMPASPGGLRRYRANRTEAASSGGKAAGSEIAACAVDKSPVTSVQNKENVNAYEDNRTGGTGACFLVWIPGGRRCCVCGDRRCASAHNVSVSGPTLVAPPPKPKASALGTSRKCKSRCCRSFVLQNPLQAMVRVYRLLLVGLRDRLRFPPAPAEQTQATEARWRTTDGL
jgi:hypothetical protein